MKRLLFVFITLVLVFFTSTGIIAQTRDTALKGKSKRIVDSLSKEMDVFDFLNKNFHFNLNAKPDTLKLKPTKFFFALMPTVGYTLESHFLGNVAINTSFYIGNADSTNLSIVNYNVIYTELHQFFLPIISNIWSKNNTINWLGDWRFYIYPSYTYGLGGNTTPCEADLIDYSYVRFYQEALVHFGSYCYFGGGVNYDNHFDIEEKGSNTTYDLYNQGAKKTTSSGPVVQFMYDSRTNINNPRDAFYGSITYRYNPTFFGSSQPWQSAFIEFKKYIRVSSYSHNVLALWSWNVFTFGGNAPYLDLPSTGWDIYSNSGRGYIQGRYRGQNMFYDEAEYRFRITCNGLLGGVLFVNAESVSNYPQNKFTTIDPGEGFGVRLKMNKYSDVNICLDYAFGLMGSQGLFFNLGEVF